MQRLDSQGDWSLHLVGKSSTETAESNRIYPNCTQIARRKNRGGGSLAGRLGFVA
jgi:hypothetical protein